MRSLVDLILSSLLLPLTTSAQDTFLLFVSSHDGPLTDVLTVVFSILLLTRSSDVISSSSLSSYLICLYPSIISRNFLNSLPCSGFIKKSAIIFSVGQYLTSICSLLMRSFLQKYLLSICFVFWPLDILPFLIIFMALWLS